MRLRTVALVFALVAPASAFAQQSNAPRPRLGDTVTTASGLRYLFVKHGGGPRPQTGDVMSIHGIGLFTDGKEFWNTRTDSSLWVYRFGVDRIIRGTEEGLREVREGDRIIMILKPELAYGERGNPRSNIPPNTTLVFDYEVMSVKPRTPAPSPSRLIPIMIETQYGNIEADLDSAHAPVTVTNFLRYIDAKLFDNGTFFRVVRMDNQPNDSVKIQVVQGGMARERRSQGFPPIPLERTSVTGLRHADGTLSMARSGPDTGTNQFSIMVGDQFELDFGGKRNPDGQGFAAFGRVTKGMDIVRKIQEQPANGQTLVTPVTILRIVRR